MARSVCAVLLLVSLAGWGCASNQGAPAEETATATAAVPDDSPLAKITMGMNDSDVRKVLGEPTSQTPT
jgi:outer membrane protein assembly factor BamE (lipoprotein component of BamABCDE complex)